MENVNQTLENVIRSGSQQTQGQSTTTDLNRNTALVFYTLTMNLRFPELDISSIPYQVSRKIAEASIGCTRPFDDVWTEVVERQRSLARSSRAA